MPLTHHPTGLTSIPSGCAFSLVAVCLKQFDVIRRTFRLYSHCAANDQRPADRIQLQSLCYNLPKEGAGFRVQVAEGGGKL